MSRRSELCSYFISGGCSKGDACGFSHDLTVHAPAGAEACAGGFILSANVVNHHLVPKSRSPPPPSKMSEVDWAESDFGDDAAAAAAQVEDEVDSHPPPLTTAWAGPKLSSKPRLNVNAKAFVPPPTTMPLTSAHSGPYPAAGPTTEKWLPRNLFGFGPNHHQHYSTTSAMRPGAHRMAMGMDAAAGSSSYASAVEWDHSGQDAAYYYGSSSTASSYSSSSSYPMYEGPRQGTADSYHYLQQQMEVTEYTSFAHRRLQAMRTPLRGKGPEDTGMER